MFQAMAYLGILLTCLFIPIIQGDDGLSPHVDLSITLKLSLRRRIRVPKICTEEICAKTAQEFLRYLDLTADPCDDFYQFTCGNFVKEKLPPDTNAESEFVNVHEKLWSNLKNILEEPIIESEENIVTQIKLTYQSCMNSTAAEVESLQAMKNNLNELGGWPLIDGAKWKDNEQNILPILIRLQMCGMPGLFRLLLQKFDHSSEFPTLLIIRPELSLPNNYYDKKSKEKILKVLKSYILNVSVSLGEMEKDDIITKSVEDIVDFETKLAECGRADATLEERQEKFLSLDKLKQKFEKVFDFEVLLNSIFKEVDIDVMTNENIGIIDMPYINCLSKLVEKTPKKDIVNYLIWRMVQNSIIALPKKFEEFFNNFQEIIHGTNTMGPRWKKCVALVNENFQQSIGYLYVKRYFKESTKKKVIDIVSNLKKAYATILSKTWLLEETKVEAKSKLMEMKENIGYPDYFETLKISHSFNKLNISGSTFLEILHLTKISRTKDILKKLRDPIDPKTMPMPIASTKRFYDLRLNRLVIPAGIIVSPFYSESHPMYINFGGIGVFIGHEIIHGFDSFGSQFDKSGEIKKWWQHNDRERFANKSTCLTNQFNELILTDINQKVNGSLTIVENIADAGGLRIAYTAYKDWLRRNGEEKQLPGIPYTSEQMFFIAYARNFCEKLSNELAKKAIRTDPHSPSKFRVNMPLKNMKVFSRTFKCKTNSTMNPLKKCRIW